MIMAESITQPSGTMKESNLGHYADVHGLKMYYETHGAGFPLVLLHGGLSAIGTSFGKILPGLARGRKIIAKVKQLNREFVDWPPDAIASIKAPTLLIAGDSDIVRPEHVVELFRLLGGGVPGANVGLPNAQLAVLPGTTHITLVDRADWLISMITGFLDAPRPS